jgi:hypothetical protein
MSAPVSPSRSICVRADQPLPSSCCATVRVSRAKTAGFLLVAGLKYFLQFLQAGCGQEQMTKLSRAVHAMFIWVRFNGLVDHKPCRVSE